MALAFSDLSPAIQKQIDQKVSFVQKRFDGDIKYAQNTLIADLKKAYQHGLSFVAIAKLRKAHGSASFEKVGRELFTAMHERQEKLANRKPRKKAARKAAKKKATRKKAASKPSASEPKKAARKTKSRGERRGKPSRAGRRKEDRHYVNIDDQPKHLVLVSINGETTDHRFSSKNDARDCIQALMAKGISPRRITYYQRADFHVGVKLV